MSLLSSAFRLTYEISPILFTGGIAANIPGGILPVVSLTEASNFITGLLSGGDALNLDNFFAHFVPMQGASLIAQRIGKYPFANQAVAGNATIADPLTVSLRMICPARSPGGYAAKLATMTALQSAVAQHNASGGTYTVCTPSFFWTNCVMTGLRDVSASSSAQPQTEWQWDFEQPLLTLAAANQAQNNLISKITGGTQITAVNGAIPWSGLAPTVNVPPSIAGPSVVGAASSLGGALVASPTNATSFIGPF